MAEYTVTRNERKKDKEIHLNGGKVIAFDGTTSTAELTEAEVTYLQNHGYNAEEVVEEVVEEET